MFCPFAFCIRLALYHSGVDTMGSWTEEGMELPLGSGGFDQSPRAHYVFPHSMLWYSSDASPLSYHYNAVRSTPTVWSSLVSNVLWLCGDGSTFASVARIIFPAQPHFRALHPRQECMPIDSGGQDGSERVWYMTYIIYSFIQLFSVSSIRMLGPINCDDVWLIIWRVAKEFVETWAWPSQKSKEKDRRRATFKTVWICLAFQTSWGCYKGLGEIV